jgi:hypothetical protein
MRSLRLRPSQTVTVPNPGAGTACWGRSKSDRCHIRFAPKAVIPPWSARCPLCAMCGRLSVGKGIFDVLSFGRCGHVCGLLMRHTKAAGHNAFR